MKYEFAEETMEHEGHVLHRIRALRDIPPRGVRAGDLGGWIESEASLSQKGECWVDNDAKIYGNASVRGGAWVGGSAQVCGSAQVFGNALVYGDAKVYGRAEVSGDAKVYGRAEVSDGAKVYDSAQVFGNALVYGDAKVYGRAEICDQASVASLEDYAVFKNFWSSGRWFTYTRSNHMWKAGCFHGTGEELIAKAYKDSEISGRCYEAAVRFVEAVESARRKS